MLRDILAALGSPKVFAITLANDDPRRLVEQPVNAAMQRPSSASLASAR
ncbi:MAG: hypothetical protein WC573_10240 [Brevundimonas sp.]